MVRCALREGVLRVVNYLDDFCIVCRDQEVVIAILHRIGFFVSFGKLASPSTTSLFLGIIIDTIKLEMRLPEDKLIRLVTILEEVKGRRKVTRKELERLGGVLAHCSKVVKGGRTICRRIYDAINSVREPHFKVRPSCGFRDDIKILGSFTEHIATYSDASNFSYGALHGGDWVAEAFLASEDECLRAQISTL